MSVESSVRPDRDRRYIAFVFIIDLLIGVRKENVAYKEFLCFSFTFVSH